MGQKSTTQASEVPQIQSELKLPATDPAQEYQDKGSLTTQDWKKPSAVAGLSRLQTAPRGQNARRKDFKSELLERFEKQKIIESEPTNINLITSSHFFKVKKPKKVIVSPVKVKESKVEQSPQPKKAAAKTEKKKVVNLISVEKSIAKKRDKKIKILSLISNESTAYHDKNADISKSLDSGRPKRAKSKESARSSSR